MPAKAAPPMRPDRPSCPSTSTCRKTSSSQNDGIDVKESITLMDSFMVVCGDSGPGGDGAAFVTPIVIEKPAAPVGITLDVSKRNGINISLTRLFGSFVPKRLFRTEDEAFHRIGDAAWPQGDSPGKPGIPVQTGAAGHQVEER